MEEAIRKQQIRGQLPSSPAGIGDPPLPTVDGSSQPAIDFSDPRAIELLKIWARDPSVWSGEIHFEKIPEGKREAAIQREKNIDQQKFDDRKELDSAREALFELKAQLIQFKNQHGKYPASAKELNLTADFCGQDRRGCYFECNLRSDGYRITATPTTKSEVGAMAVESDPEFSPDDLWHSRK